MTFDHEKRSNVSEIKSKRYLLGRDDNCVVSVLNLVQFDSLQSIVRTRCYNAAPPKGRTVKLVELSITEPCFDRLLSELGEQRTH